MKKKTCKLARKIANYVLIPNHFKSPTKKQGPSFNLF